MTVWRRLLILRSLGAIAVLSSIAMLIESRVNSYTFYGLEPLGITIALWRTESGLLIPKLLAILSATPDAFLGLWTAPTSYVLGRLKLQGWRGDLAIVLTPLNFVLWFALFQARRRISLRRPSPLGDAGDRFDEELMDLYVGIRTMIQDSRAQHRELIDLEPTLNELQSSLQKESYSASLTAAGRILESVLSAYGRAVGANLSSRQALFSQIEALEKSGDPEGKVRRLRPLLDIVRLYRNLGAHQGSRIPSRIDVLLALMSLAQCLELILPENWFDGQVHEIPMSE